MDGPAKPGPVFHSLKLWRRKPIREAQGDHHPEPGNRHQQREKSRKPSRAKPARFDGGLKIAFEAFEEIGHFHITPPFGLFYPLEATIAAQSASSITSMPSSVAFLSFDPAPGPATTRSVFALTDPDVLAPNASA